MLLALLTLVACSNTQTPAFGGGGTRTASGIGGSVGGSGDNGGDSGDSGSGDSGSDTGVPEGSAYLSGFVLSMTTSESAVTSVSGEVSVTDSEGDVGGGTAYLDWSSGSSSDSANLNIASGADGTATEYAYLSGDTLYVYVENLNPAYEYQFTLQVRDQSGNLSNAVEGTAGPM